MTVRYPILAPDVQIKPIPSCPRYFASSDGRIWSSCRSIELRELKPSLGKHGHLRVGIVDVEGKYRCRFVHRLVLEAFVGPCPPGYQGCHDPDPSPSNCNLSNLRWDTCQGNHDDRVRAGRQPYGAKNGRAKLTEEQIRDIFAAIAAGVSQRRLARMYGITRTSIRYILLRKNWKYLEGPPPIKSRPLLTESQAARIIQLGRQGMNQYEIAKRFGTTQSNVSLIILGKSWRGLHRDDRWKALIASEPDSACGP